MSNKCLDDELFNIYVQDRKTILESLREIYDKGRAEALDIDLDTPMHFTNEQKAWIKKYIISNGQANYERGAKEFAEWLCASYIVSDTLGKRKWAEDLLAKWQKGEL